MLPNSPSLMALRSFFCVASACVGVSIYIYIHAPCAYIYMYIHIYIYVIDVYIYTYIRMCYITTQHIHVELSLSKRFWITPQGRFQLVVALTCASHVPIVSIVVLFLGYPIL